MEKQHQQQQKTQDHFLNAIKIINIIQAKTKRNKNATKKTYK